MERFTDSRKEASLRDLPECNSGFRCGVAFEGRGGITSPGALDGTPSCTRATKLVKPPGHPKHPVPQVATATLPSPNHP